MVPTKKGTSLLDTLRQKQAQSGSAKTAAAEKGGAATKPKKSILSGPRGPVFETYNFIRSTEADARFEEVLQEASPFLSPLSLAQFVELVYCEATHSRHLYDRMKKFADTNVLFSGVSGKKSSLRLNVEVMEWISQEIGGANLSSLSIFIEWTMMEWPQIKSKLTYKGNK